MVDLPLMEVLDALFPIFRSTKDSTVDSDLVIFVTPHILTDRGRLKDEERETAIRQRFGEPAVPAVPTIAAEPATAH